MCAVSTISDYYGRPFPQYFPPPRSWDEDTKEMMRKVIEMLDKIDKRLGDKDCMDDKKRQFFEYIDFSNPHTTETLKGTTT